MRRFLVISVAALCLVSCGGGGGLAGPVVNPFHGSYTGWVQDPSGTLYASIKLAVADDGTVSGDLIDSTDHTDSGVWGQVDAEGNWVGGIGAVVNTANGTMHHTSQGTTFTFEPAPHGYTSSYALLSP